MMFFDNKKEDASILFSLLGFLVCNTLCDHCIRNF